MRLNRQPFDRKGLPLPDNLYEAPCEIPELKEWDGLGFAIQAYQKCAPVVIEWAEGLKQPLMVHLTRARIARSSDQEKSLFFFEKKTFLVRG